MFRKTMVIGHAVFAAVLCSPALLGQQAPAPPSSHEAHEFPVVMRQNVDAGKTQVGAKIQAKLVIATLVNGTVIPRDAILSGEVTESVAKTATDPSRLAIRIDSAQWKNGAAPLQAYLTAWYYPIATMMGQDPYQSADTPRSSRNWDGMGTYPDPHNEVSQQKFPGRDTGDDSGLATPGSPASHISKHRVLMKNVESVRSTDGAVTLTSKRSNIKLDKFTTYVLATGDLLPTN